MSFGMMIKRHNKLDENVTLQRDRYEIVTLYNELNRCESLKEVLILVGVCLVFSYPLMSCKL